MENYKELAAVKCPSKRYSVKAIMHDLPFGACTYGHQGEAAEDAILINAVIGGKISVARTSWHASHLYFPLSRNRKSHREQNGETMYRSLRVLTFHTHARVTIGDHFFEPLSAQTCNPQYLLKPRRHEKLYITQQG
jgi:hypothetical protein